MEKVFLLIVEDRHADTDVQVFKQREDALGTARRVIAVEDPEGEFQPDLHAGADLTDRMVIDGWIYWAVYSPEGDSVRVVERSVR